MIRPFISRCLRQCKHVDKQPFQSALYATSRVYEQCHFATYSTHTTNQGSLPWSKLPYNSVRVNLNDALQQGWNEIADFPYMLKASLVEWRSHNCSAVWLHIPISLSALISQAAEQGFTLHHAKNQEVVMSKWLLDSRPNKLPPYASHQVGVCGIVYREDKDEILVTQDKHKPPVWKFPGGLSEYAEDIPDAAKREVKEETGVESEFQSLLAFRQQHRLKSYHDLSDLYFICRMKPLTFDLHPCPDELVKCEWKKLPELVSSTDATVLTQRVSKLLLQGKREGFNTIDIGMEEWPMMFTGWTPDKTYKLFLRSTVRTDHSQ